MLEVLKVICFFLAVVLIFVISIGLGVQLLVSLCDLISEKNRKE
jgi:hypothetical protein